MDNVVFIHRGGEQMASYRIRAKIPAEQIGATVNEGDAYIAVFSKPMEGDEKSAEIIKKNGGKVVLDICDPHDYRHMVKYADIITTPTRVCADIILKQYGIAAEIIPDCYEMDLLPPHADGDKRVWVGHKLNLEDIVPYRDMDNLRIVTGPNHPEGTTFWTPENAHRAMSEASLFLLPTRRGAEYKSPNRLLNALRMGLFPVCDPHPAYEEFKGIVWACGLPTGLRWCKEFKADLNGLVSMGQKYIEKYSPERVGERWKEVLGSI